jgi:hypothetical protein
MKKEIELGYIMSLKKVQLLFFADSVSKMY